MHEFNLTQNLLDRALRKSNSKKIVRVHLLIGPFSEEREDAIRFYWKDLAKGSFGEGAELLFDHVKAEMQCFDCTGITYFDEHEGSSMCKYCFSEHVQVLSEENVLLESIEVE